jgi:hypothetical protein
MIILLLWVWNFAISILNAWICGKTWNESKHAGGLPRFMNWCGAVMSASGFTWCYLLVIGFFGATIPIIKNEEGVRETLLTVEQLHVFMDLGYLVVIFPILGSGLAITVHAWGVFWRRRRITDGAVAAYDTFAMIYNISSALRHVPRAGGNVFGYFFGGSSSDSSSSDSKGKGLVLLLVILAVAGGILTTRWIILSTAKATAANRGLFYRNRYPDIFDAKPKAKGASPWEAPRREPAPRRRTDGPERYV